MDLALTVQPDIETPLHRQVYDGIRTAILTGLLRPGDRLPPSRVLAGQLSLSRMTVSEAYDQLQTEGYVQGRRGSGTYVAPDLSAWVLPSATVPAGADRARPPELSPFGRRVAGAAQPNVSPVLRWDLRPNRVADDLFPWDAWEDATRTALSRHRSALVSPPPAAGLPLLREAIAAHVSRYRAVVCSADQVVVVTGSQQGLSLLAQLLLRPGDRVAIEDPGYPAARQALEAHGTTVSHVPVDTEGLRVDTLDRAGRHRLVYVTPSHQHPTGATMSLSRRLALLELAGRERMTVLEDDYDSEFRYEGSPIESLQGLDRWGQVIYAGTFSKSVLPGLRIGFVVLPEPLVEAFAAAKSLQDGGTPMMEQVVLAEFMVSGSFERHIRRMRRVYRSRRDAFLATLARELGDSVSIGPCHGGLTALVNVDALRKAEDIAARAAGKGLAVRPATAYYAVAQERSSFLIGFGGLPESQAPEAVAVLRSAALDTE